MIEDKFNDALWERLKSGVTMPDAAQSAMNEGVHGVNAWTLRYPERRISVTLSRNEGTWLYWVTIRRGDDLLVKFQGRGAIFVNLATDTFHAIAASA